MCAPIPKDKWAWKYDECKRCGTKSKKGRHLHKGKGLCLSCWDSIRSLKPNRIAYKKVAHTKWYVKVKDTEEYRDYTNKRALEYRLKSPAYQTFLKKQYIRLKFRRFILKTREQNGRLLKREQDGLTFRCDGCYKNCLVKTPIKPDKRTDCETEQAIRLIDIFKKEQIRVCKL